MTKRALAVNSPSLVNCGRSAAPSDDDGASAPRRVPRPRVVHGSCTKQMRRLRTGSTRLVLADPPYGIRIAAWDGAADYMEFAHAWLAQAVRVLQPGGSLLFFASPCELWSSRMNVLLADTLGMVHQQTLTWVYSQGGDTRLETMRRYAVRSETVEWWTKGSEAHTFNPLFATEPYTEGDKRVALAKGVGRVNEASLDKGRPPRTWMDIPRENSRSKERQYGKHPSMKPMSLAERLVNVHSNPGDRVVVPFAGSGSEVLAASKLGREVIGYETENDYIELMRKRFEGHAVDAAVCIAA
jgi:site-specific DNA-methyltransferase (adenine-specific)/adenine-specific DNA-methyltransferase